MQYEVEIDGRIRHVVVLHEPSGFSVTVDGKAWHVEAGRVDGHTLSLLIGGESHEVTVAPLPGTTQLVVRVGTTPVAVTLNGRRGVRRKDAGAGGSGPQKVMAPMPGKIVRVLVKPGDAVAARQGLVVIEAMKMENELRAARAGTVADVYAKEGASVDAGAPLVLIE